MTWISWTNVSLGLWLVIAAFALPHASGDAVPEDIIAGLFIAITAVWAARTFGPRVSSLASLTVLLIGLWTASAPFVLGYGHRSLSMVNDLFVGLAVVALAGVNMWIKDQMVAR